MTMIDGRLKSLQSLVSEVEILSVTGTLDRRVSGVVADSRQVESGYVYVAIRGQTHDGHQYVTAAINNGAVAVVGELPPSDLGSLTATYLQVSNSRKALGEVASWFLDHPTQDLFVIGITGTNGKTSTAHFITRLLGPENVRMITTLTNKNGPDMSRPVTTPIATEIHDQARQAVEQDRSYLIVEASSHGLALKRLAGVRLDCAVFTNLSRDHLDFHQSMESYRKTKLKLFQQLSPDGWAVVNKDDSFSNRIVNSTDAEILSYGTCRDAEITASHISDANGELSFRVQFEDRRKRVSLPLLGRFNVFNLLAAMGVGIVVDLDFPKLTRRWVDVEAPPGRMKTISLKGGGTAVVDFAHNPRGLKASLEGLQGSNGQLIVVFGCGGDSDEGKRSQMGRVAEQYADYAILTNDNPKSEPPESILEQIASGFSSSEHYSIIPDREDAIRKGASLARAGDSVLIAGKGHERKQVFQDRIVNYNDMHFIKDSLALD